MTTIATLPQAVRCRFSRGPWAAALAWGALIGAVAVAEGPTAPGRAAGSSRRPVVDPAVVPAGGCGHGQCGPGGCRHDHARHHRDCRNGVCAPYCPVRPSTFGFHGTQWRRWPGQAVVPVSNEQAVTPATPPRLEVPRVEEESLGPAPGDLPAPGLEPAAEQPPAAEAAVVPEEPPAPIQPPVAPEPEAMPAEPTAPAAEGEPAEPKAEEEAAPAEPRELPRGEDEPAKTPGEAAPPEPAPRPEDENLFDESAARRVTRRIPVAMAALPPAATDAEGESAVRATFHEDRQADVAVEPDAAIDRTPVIPATEPPATRRGWLAVPRVAFDPVAETARLKASDTRGKKAAPR